MKRKTFKNLSPRHTLEIVIANKEERKEIGKEERERKDLLIIHEELSQPEQLSVIAGKLFKEGINIFEYKKCREGRSVFIDGFMREILDWMDLRVDPKCTRQAYTFYNIAPKFQLGIEFNTWEIAKMRNPERNLHGKCRRNDGVEAFPPGQLNPDIKVDVLITITEMNGELKTSEEIFQIFFHEICHAVTDAIAPVFGFWYENKIEFETQAIIYEDLILELLERCWLWK